MPFTGDVLDNQPARCHNSGIDPSDSPGRHPPRRCNMKRVCGAGTVRRSGGPGAWAARGWQGASPTGGDGGSAARTEGTAVMGESEKGSVRFGGIWRRILE
jgi:hypothetical protein